MQDDADLPKYLSENRLVTTSGEPAHWPFGQLHARCVHVFGFRCPYPRGTVTGV